MLKLQQLGEISRNKLHKRTLFLHFNVKTNLHEKPTLWKHIALEWPRDECWTVCTLKFVLYSLKSYKSFSFLVWVFKEVFRDKVEYNVFSQVMNKATSYLLNYVDFSNNSLKSVWITDSSVLRQLPWKQQGQPEQQKCPYL